MLEQTCPGHGGSIPELCQGNPGPGAPVRGRSCLWALEHVGGWAECTGRGRALRREGVRCEERPQGGGAVGASGSHGSVWGEPVSWQTVPELLIGEPEALARFPGKDWRPREACGVARWQGQAGS